MQCASTSPAARCFGRRGSGVVAAAAAHGAGRMASSQTQPSTKLRRTELPLEGGDGPLRHSFRVLTFNILADGLAQHGEFVKVPPEVLTWEYRLPLLVEEIAESRADIVCLQEANHFDQLEAQLGRLGYNGLFLPKCPAPACRYSCPPDGMAIFINSCRFVCVGDPVGRMFEGEGGASEPQGFLQVLLHDQLCNRRLVVATTHLKAKEGEENDARRLMQAQQLLQQLGRRDVQPSSGNGTKPQQGTALSAPAALSAADAALVQSSAASAAAAAVAAPLAPQHLLASGPVPVLVCGDFNTEPSSSACAAMQAPPLGLQSIWDVPWAAAGGGGLSAGPASLPAAAAAAAAAPAPTPPSEAVPSQSAAPRDALGAPAVAAAAPAAAAAVSDARLNPEFSTWKFRPKGESRRIIDYIWFTPRRLGAMSRWHMLTATEIGPTGLPSSRYPSDHIALLAQFGWRESDLLGL